jgi:hypothetical protein
MGARAAAVLKQARALIEAYHVASSDFLSFFYLPNTSSFLVFGLFTKDCRCVLRVRVGWITAIAW